MGHIIKGRFETFPLKPEGTKMWGGEKGSAGADAGLFSITKVGIAETSICCVML